MRVKNRETEQALREVRRQRTPAGARELHVIDITAGTPDVAPAA